MRYFKEKNGGNEWRVDGSIVEYRYGAWTTSDYKSAEEIIGHGVATETDAAGNPLGKYRYFRNTAIPAGEWRTNGTTWELRVGPGDDWGRSTCSAVEEFMFDPTAYECDARGNRLEGKTAESPTPAPMSEEDRFRWQFAGQAAAQCIQGQLASMAGSEFSLNPESCVEGAVDCGIAFADALIAALKKPKATENGGGK